MIGILDYRICNVCSVQRMFDRLGVECRILRSSAEVRLADKLILPGVGHFDRGVEGLREHFDLDLIRERVVGERVPVLGICLGMQLLCRDSEEGDERGLGLVDASVVKMATQGLALKTPHMGWNSVKAERPNVLIPDGAEPPRFYFVHSFVVRPDRRDLAVGITDYGLPFCSAFEQGHIFGVQFHPEKSHRFGLELFSRFAAFAS